MNPMTQPTPESKLSDLPLSSDRVLANKHLEGAAEVEQYSKKRLVQTSPPYLSTIEALDAANANQQLPECDYAYVTEDNRVVGIYDYYDVTPDQPVKPGQKRILIPNYPQ